MRKRGKYEAAPPAPSARKAGSMHLQMLISSIVSLVLCCSMLLGTTMAWFTDTVTSTSNQITIGKLKVDVLYNDYSLRNTSTPIFGGEGDKVWIPDESRVKLLTVLNEGNLDLNYSLTFLTQEEVSQAFQYFHVYAIKVSDEESIPTFEAMKTDENYKGTLYDILVNKSPVFAGTLKAGTEEQPTQETYAIALYMDSDVQDNSIQGANLTLNIQLHAYQSNAPEDEVGTPTEATESTNTEATESTNTETTE